ncbi:MAG TPA: DUF4214 domain-containing protein [Noviherbaspirillum sp.]|nr:DUF4214 domain-containing protein [Noviherbaspirillum sp.]
MAITTQMRTYVANLYVALFGRAPERDGLGYWVQQLDAGKTVAQVAQEMYNTEPARANYPTFLTNEEIITKFYKNVLGRTDAQIAADSDGIGYWTAKLVAGKTQGEVISEMITAVTSFTGTGDDALSVAARDSKALFNNKVAVSLYYAVDLGGNDVSKASTILTGVTKDAASVEAAKTGASSSVGQTYTLTKGINEFTGGTGNDTFDATEDSTATATFSNLDKLDGGNGTDTLKIVQAAAVDTTAVTGVTIANIENVSITSGAGVTANSSSWVGATNLTISSGDDVTATAAATTDVTIAASALSGAAGNEVTVNGGKSVTITAADTSTTAAASASNISVGATVAAAGAVNVTYTETISDGAANAGVTGGDITVTGGTTVTVNSLAVAGAGSHADDVLTLGNVVVNGNASTTEVTVKQSAATAAWAAAGDKIKITNGAVTIEDKNAATASDTITKVTLENFGASEIKSTVLNTLNLTAGATIAGGAVVLTQTAADTSTAATTLALNTSGSFGKISGTQADVYTTLNVTAAAATTIADIEMDKLATLNVGGTGVTTFTALTAAQNASLTSVVSTGGGLTIGTELDTDVAVTGGAGVENVMIGGTTKVVDLGGGNDVVTVSTTSLGAGGAVKGGEGTDTLVANTNTSAFAGLPGFTGFETLRVAGAAAQGAHNAVGFTALELGATAAAASSFINVAAGVGLTVLAAPGGAHTVTLADATGTADTFALTLKSAASLDLSVNGITLNGVETINLTNTDSLTTTASGINTNKLKLTADAVKSIVVTGNAGLDLTGSVYAKVTNFDASGITGASTDAAALAVTYVSGNSTIAENVTIKGGAGNDSLTGNAANNDTISGNAGADTLVYTGGADSFNGGAGADTFDVNATGTKTAFLTIEDAVAKDIIDLAGLMGTPANVDYAAGAAGFGAQKVTLGAAATLDQYLDAAAADNGAGTGDEIVAWFNFGGNTYLVVDNSDNTTFTSGTDAVVKLTGVIDLTSSAVVNGVLTLA